jgi:hypothetical protein
MPRSCIPPQQRTHAKTLTPTAADRQADRSLGQSPPAAHRPPAACRDGHAGPVSPQDFLLFGLQSSHHRVRWAGLLLLGHGRPACATTHRGKAQGIERFPLFSRLTSAPPLPERCCFVPPSGDFGDWATPKGPMAGLFLPGFRRRPPGEPPPALLSQTFVPPPQNNLYPIEGCFVVWATAAGHRPVPHSYPAGPSTRESGGVLLAQGRLRRSAGRSGESAYHWG